MTSNEAKNVKNMNAHEWTARCDAYFAWRKRYVDELLAPRGVDGSILEELPMTIACDNADDLDVVRYNEIRSVLYSAGLRFMRLRSVYLKRVRKSMQGRRLSSYLVWEDSYFRAGCRYDEIDRAQRRQ